ncbi:MAG: hypothetical protein ACFCUR_11660 [Rhodomicrobiaceae bacterium]
MLEAASALQLAQGAVAAVQDKFGVEATQLRERIAKIADTLSCGTIPTDVLRHRLWLGIGRALGAEALLPLSTRHMREATCACGVRAAERLGPGLLAHEEEEAFAKSSIGSRIFGKALDLAEKIAGQKTARSMSFPDIVAGELDVFLKSLHAADAEGSLDPAIAESVKKGQAAMARAAASGGGWVAIAAAVGSAGFAPYIFAAQLSAFIPLVSGPGLVSFLAVIINPVTVVAGLAALGTWAVKGQAHTVRCTVASRLAVLLALRGMEQPENGLAALVTAFRSLSGLRPTELTHLSPREVETIQARAQRVEIRLGRTLPPAQGMAPGKWGEPMDIKRLASVVDTAAVASLTAADMLFHAAAINPSVLAAADFSRHADFATPFDLATYVADFASDGARINLRGYTAEQIVLARLVDQGHSAELAANTRN